MTTRTGASSPSGYTNFYFFSNSFGTCFSPLWYFLSITESKEGCPGCPRHSSEQSPHKPQRSSTWKPERHHYGSTETPALLLKQRSHFPLLFTPEPFMPLATAAVAMAAEAGSPWKAPCVAQRRAGASAPCSAWPGRAAPTARGVQAHSSAIPAAAPGSASHHRGFCDVGTRQKATNLSQTRRPLDEDGCHYTSSAMIDAQPQQQKVPVAAILLSCLCTCSHPHCVTMGAEPHYKSKTHQIKEYMYFLLCIQAQRLCTDPAPASDSSLVFRVKHTEGSQKPLSVETLSRTTSTQECLRLFAAHLHGSTLTGNRPGTAERSSSSVTFPFSLQGFKTVCHIVCRTVQDSSHVVNTFQVWSTANFFSKGNLL